MIDIIKKVNEIFVKNFGRTPLQMRLNDINNENIELQRWLTMNNLKEELGDLLASAIQLANENNWDVEELIANTLEKIERRQLQYKSLGRKINVALYGGAFNPIHNDHIAVAQFVLNTSKFIDEVWITPCYSHLYGKKMVNPQQRLEMCQIAAKKDGRVRVFNYEIQHQLQGETYYFIQKLLDDPVYYDKYHFSYIIGQDNANTFDKWYNFEILERMIQFIVVPRKNIKPIENAWYLKAPHIYLTDENTISNGSSSEIRDQLKNNLIPSNLDPLVLQYIQKNNLQF